MSRRWLPVPPNVLLEMWVSMVPMAPKFDTASAVAPMCRPRMSVVVSSCANAGEDASSSATTIGINMPDR